MECKGVDDVEGGGGREGEISTILDAFYSHFDAQEWERVVAMETQVEDIAREMCANPAWPSNIACGVYSMIAEAFTSLGQCDRAAEMQAMADAVLPPAGAEAVAEAVVEDVEEEVGPILSATFLVRHGARYPNRDQLTPFAAGSAVRLQWAAGIASTDSDDGDNLTPVGRAQMRALGARLLETGSTLRDIAKARPSLLLLASTSPRCEESGNALARAMCACVNGEEDDNPGDDDGPVMSQTNLAERGSYRLNGGLLYEPQQRDAIFRAWNTNKEYCAAVMRLRNGPLLATFAGEPSRRAQLEALFSAVDRAGGVTAAAVPTPSAMLFQCTHVVNMLACEACREDGRGVLSAALSLEEKAFARRMARWVWEQRFLTLDEEGGQPLNGAVDLERGCRVVVHGLTSSAGLLLNGKRGTLGGGLGTVRPGRYPVFIKGSSGEGYKQIKPCNVMREAGPAAKMVLRGRVPDRPVHRSPVAKVSSRWREAIGGELWRFVVRVAHPPWRSVTERHGVRVLLGHDYSLLALFAALGATRLAAALEFGAFIRIDHYEDNALVLALCAAPFGEHGGAEVDTELKMIPVGRLNADGIFCLHPDWCAEGFQARAAVSASPSESES